MKPKISICIPTYKETKYLERVLQSIISQKYGNYEVIITDDSPNNEVIDLLNTFRLGSKLKYFHNEKRLGSPRNWNEAINKASGDYIKILHHDDWFTYDYSLDVFVSEMEYNPKSNFGFSGAKVLSTNTKLNRNHLLDLNKLKLLEEPTNLLIRNIIGPPSSTIFRRNVAIRFDEKMIWHVDYDFYIRILLETNFVYIDKPLITVSPDAVNRITKFVHNDPQINVFEDLYLYKKFYNNISAKNKKACMKKIQNTLKKYNICSLSEIRHFGYTDKIYFFQRIQVFKNLLNTLKNK